MLKLVLCLLFVSSALCVGGPPPVLDDILTDIQSLQDEVEAIREILGETDSMQDVVNKLNEIQELQAKINKKISHIDVQLLRLDVRLSALEGLSPIFTDGTEGGSPDQAFSPKTSGKPSTARPTRTTTGNPTTIRPTPTTTVNPTTTARPTRTASTGKGASSGSGRTGSSENTGPRGGSGPTGSTDEPAKGSKESNDKSDGETDDDSRATGGARPGADGPGTGNSGPAGPGNSQGNGRGPTSLIGLPRFPDLRNCAPTMYDMLGPYYKEGYPRKKLVCGNDTNIQAKKLTVHGYVLENCGGLVAVNAKVEVWQANTDGDYVDDCRGYAVTDSTGYYRFTTAYPGYYIPRPRHLHFRVTYNGFVLVTQMYFREDDHWGKVNSLTVESARPAGLDGRRVAQFNFVLM